MTTTTLRALDPRDLIRSVLLWAMLIPLALLAFLAGEITHVDLVDAVNALVYAVGALLAIMLARQSDGRSSDGPFSRTFWLAVAAFCVTFVLSELGGDLVEHVEALLSPIWLGDLLCWLGAGAFVLLVVRARPQMGTIIAPVPGLLAVGFALQSLALGLDVAEPLMPLPFGLDSQTYDNLTDLLEFVFLQLYLLAFIGLAAELTAQHALHAQISRVEAIEDSAACLRAAQLAFATAVFSTPKFSSKRRDDALASLMTRSGFGGILNAVKITRKLGPSIKQRCGKSLATQFAEQMRFMFSHGLAPKTYYLFELFIPSHARVAAQYLQRNETKAAAYKIMHRATGHRLSEKLEFHNRCRDLGLKVAPVVFAATGGAVDPQFAAVTGLPATDLFIKPRKGSGGRGAAKWKFVTPHFVGGDGTQLTPAALRQQIIEQSQQETMLVQTSLVNHGDLADINCGTLATVRIVTCRNETGSYEVTDAAFRMPRVSGSAVDNFHAGGIAAAVNIATGRLGPATDLGLKPTSGWFDTHPVTGAPIVGRQLPCWQEARDLVERAHPHFSDFAVIGWDIAILADGPTIIEANGAPDLDIIQRTQRRPLGQARLGRLMAWHVRRDLRQALLD